jgi:hypothetical protein
MFEGEMQEIYLYPNPATDLVTIKGVHQNDQIRIMSLNGTLVSASKGSKLDISGLDNGMYIINIEAGQQIQNLKLLIRK